MLIEMRVVNDDGMLVAAVTVAGPATYGNLDRVKGAMVAALEREESQAQSQYLPGLERFRIKPAEVANVDN